MFKPKRPELKKFEKIRRTLEIKAGKIIFKELNEAGKKIYGDMSKISFEKKMDIWFEGYNIISRMSNSDLKKVILKKEYKRFNCS